MSFVGSSPNSPLPRLGKSNTIRGKLKAGSFRICETEIHEHFVISHQYDPQNHLSNMCSFSGTAFEYVCKSGYFWILNAKHLLFFLLWYYATDEIKEEVLKHWTLKPEHISSLSALVVFSIVFYTGNAYSTYKTMFDFAVDTHSDLVVYSTHLKGLFKDSDDVWSSVRHLLAAQRVYFYELKRRLAEYAAVEPGSENHPGIWEDWARTNLVQTNLLKREEVVYLGEKYGPGNKVSLLASWSEASFQEHSKSNQHFQALPPPLQAAYLNKSLHYSAGLQTLLMSISRAKEFGVPFVYHHIVHAIVTAYLIMYSIATIFVNDDGEVNFWTLITYPVVCFVTLGILASADAMADPFGDDDCDFNLDAITVGSYNEIMRLVSFIDTDNDIMDVVLDRNLKSRPESPENHQPPPNPAALQSGLNAPELSESVSRSSRSSHSSVISSSEIPQPTASLVVYSHIGERALGEVPSTVAPTAEPAPAEGRLFCDC